MRLRGSRARELRYAAIAFLLVTPTCLCRQVSGADIEDGGQTALSDAGDSGLDAGSDGGRDAGGDAGQDAGDDAGPDAGEDAGADAGPDAGADSGVLRVPDSGVGACGLPISDLTAFVTYPLGDVGTPFASADLNGDGLLDLIAGGDADTGFSVLFGLRDGGLGVPIRYSLLGVFIWFVVGDLNGDGSPDLVLADNGDAPAGLTIYLNDGDGGLMPQPPFSTPELVDGVAIGDLNGDGRADLLVNTNDTNTWFWEVYFQRSDGGFSAPSRLPIPSPSEPEVVFGDLNGDGLQDFITASDDQLNVAVFLNQGDGGFETTLYPAPALGQIGLLTRAGRLPDIVVGETGWAGPPGESVLGIGVMANLGEGTFAEPVTYTIAGGGVFAIGDFNGDCIPDIASPSNAQGACQAGWPISVLYGTADGGFTGPENLNATGEGPGAIAVLGSVDNPRAIAVGDYCGSGVTVYGDASKH